MLNHENIIRRPLPLFAHERDSYHKRLTNNIDCRVQNEKL